MPPEGRPTSPDLPPELEDEVYRLLLEGGPQPAEQALAELCARHPDHSAALRRLAGKLAGGELVLAAMAGGGEEALAEGGRIGPFQLVRLLGEGGFGEVWLARQEAPIRRQVALKLIRPGMDTRRVLARFEAERQVLALMEHACIARVFDAGATERGRPYFVMEYVQGEPITSWCDARGLPLDARIRLFLDVCAGVAHAHRKGIIHRDLKPSNVLVAEVDGKATPKIIDFGIAKAASQESGVATLTVAGALLGTPEYMSPEQAGGTVHDVDTRSDVYAMGCMFYELLAGVPPVDRETWSAAGAAEVARIIREVEAARPSSRVATLGGAAGDVAGRRGLDPTGLVRALRGDLDWIVLRAVAKERERRYQSVQDLAADLERHLRDEPVQARPPSAAYRMGRFARRNKALVAGAAATLLALVVGLVATTAMYLRAEGEAHKAQTAEAEATERARDLEQVAAFQAAQLSGLDVPAMGIALRADLLQRARRGLMAAGREEAEVEGELADLDTALAAVNFTDLVLGLLDEGILGRALSAIGEGFADQPLLKARLLQSTASTMTRLGLLERAWAPQQEALEIRRSLLGERHLDTMGSVGEKGNLLYWQGRLAEAEHDYREALDVLRVALGPEDPLTLRYVQNMGSLLFRQGRLAKAERYLRQALEGQRRVLGREDPETLAAASNLGLVLRGLGRLEEAEPYHRAALEGLRRVRGRDHPDTLAAAAYLGFLLRSQGRHAEAEPYYRETMEGRLRIHGEDHVETLEAVGNLGVLLWDGGNLQEAERYILRAVEGHRRAVGDDHRSTLSWIGNLGAVLFDQGRLAEVERLDREVLEVRLRVLGESDPDTLASMANLGATLEAMGRDAEAVELLARAAGGARGLLAPDRPQMAAMLLRRGRMLGRMERFAEAAAALEEALELFQERFGLHGEFALAALEDLADLHDAWHLAEPGAGHEETAAALRTKVATARAPHQAGEAGR